MDPHSWHCLELLSGCIAWSSHTRCDGFALAGPARANQQMVNRQQQPLGMNDRRREGFLTNAAANHAQPNPHSLDAAGGACLRANFAADACMELQSDDMPAFRTIFSTVLSGLAVAQMLGRAPA